MDTLLQPSASAIVTKDIGQSVVMNFLKRIIGQGNMASYVITPKTTLIGDLDMNVFEMLQFSGMIKSHFGEKVNFSQWILKMEVEQIAEISIRNVVDFIKSCHL